jgi:hypothetical protein
VFEETVKVNKLSPADAESAKESEPLPSVCNTCPDVPSLVGKVIASLIVKEAGTDPTSTIAAEPSFFSV